MHPSVNIHIIRHKVCLSIIAILPIQFNLMTVIQEKYNYPGTTKCGSSTDVKDRLESGGLSFFIIQ